MLPLFVFVNHLQLDIEPIMDSNRARNPKKPDGTHESAN